MGMSMDESGRLEALETQLNELLASHAALRQRVEEHLDGVDNMKEVYGEEGGGTTRSAGTRRVPRLQGEDSSG